MTKYADDYSLAEMLCVAAARMFPPSGAVMLGMGLPVLAGTLAKLIHAPGFAFCTEAGAIDWDPRPAVRRAPVSINDLLLNDGAAMVSDMVDALGTVTAGGNLAMAMLTGAQVDRYGNLNTVLIDGHDGYRRLAGTGGNTDIACDAPRMIVLMPQEERRFVDRVTYRSSPGYIDGPGARARAGLHPQGPNAVISTMGVFGFDTPDGGESGSCEMQLEGLFPNLVPEVVEISMGFPLRQSPDLRELEPPTHEEIDLLRRMDPYQAYLSPGRY